MLNLTGQYALQALIIVANEARDELVSGPRIADRTGIPRKYLSTILRELVRHRVLHSTRGKGGGFRLARPPDQILLLDALRPFEPMLSAQRPCPFGYTTCSDKDPCSGHDRWKKVREAYDGFLNSTTLQDVATKKKKKKKRRKKRP